MTAVRIREIDTPLGTLLAGASEHAVSLLAFDDQDDTPRHLLKLAAASGAIPTYGAYPIHDRLEAELAAYFAGDLRDFTVPVELVGTDFQRAVWTQISTVPYGQTRAYGVLAKALSGDAKASRAVAAANGQNRVAIMIPCHRIVGADGSLTGYAGGLARKRALLALEAGQGGLF